MDKKRLADLIKRPESAIHDYKIQCNAFTKNKAANAELAKDICAMANNGAVQSHIIIGISDDMTKASSATNEALTDANLQSFAKTNITPVPKVQLHASSIVFRGKRVQLKVIVIGKNRRQAFRLANDLIDYKSGYAFRRNEVWIRRGSTSDLAAPDEIARLVAGEDLTDPTADLTNTVYAREPKGQRRTQIMHDLGMASEGIVLHEAEQLALLRTDVGTLVLRVLYVEGFARGGKERFLFELYAHWGFEHGLLVLSPARFPPRYLDELFSGPADGCFTSLSPESWGTYGVIDLPGSGASRSERGGLLAPMFRKTLRNGPPIQIPVFLLQSVRDTRTLVRRLHRFLSFISGAQVSEAVASARHAINANLRAVVRDGRALLVPVGDPVVDRPTKELFLGADRFVNKRRFGPSEVEDARDKRYINVARYILGVSDEPIESPLPGGRILGEELLPQSPDMRAELRKTGARLHHLYGR